MAEINQLTICVGIVCITFLEALALAEGINGVYFTMVIAVIAAAVGVVIPTPKILKGG